MGADFEGLVLRITRGLEPSTATSSLPRLHYSLNLNSHERPRYAFRR